MLPPDIHALFAGPAGAVWRHFAAISVVPRPSGQEAAIRDHLLSVACLNDWEVRRDARGNVVFAVPGEGRLAGAPILVLQAHMDMVGEKHSDVAHDFARDPIRLRRDGEWVKATGTTLGADNGIGLALALALAEADLPDRVPLELLFTVEEETGLDGALGLDPALVRGRRVRNLDSEEDGIFIIGCAGGEDLAARFATTAGGAAGPALSARLHGLRGGHSGVEIHLGRANAIRAAAAAIQRARLLAPGLRLHALAGGNKRNAIPRECTFTVSGCSEAVLRATTAAVAQELRHAEPGVAWDLAPAAATPDRVRPWALLEFITRVPNGVLSMEADDPELVRSSNNVSVTAAEGAAQAVFMLARSSVRAEQEAIRAAVLGLAHELSGATAADGGYPGWAPSRDGALRRLAQRVHTELFGAPARVTCIHAGLEAGIIGDRLGTGELLAYGPTQHGAHSPDERLRIASVDTSFAFLRRLASVVE